ncbi:MAG: SurA N-terminal domain-containing protein [Treponema sp.]|nr:SurA N-terminal domain-containing protein [Treponema sp.]
MKRFAVGICILLATVALSFAQSDLQVLAVVKLNKSESVTLKELRTRVETYQKQTKKTMSIDDKKQILEAIIDEKLILQAASKAGIVIPDSQVDQYFLGQMSQQLGRPVTEKELAAIIEQQQNMSLDAYMKEQVGMDLTEYKAYLKSQLIAQRYVVSQNQNELNSVAPTDAEIRAFYDMNKAQFVWNDMLKMFLVMVPKGKNPDEAKKTAESMLNDYKNKKQTLEQIRVKSRMEGSTFQAGDLLLSKTQQNAMQVGLSYKELNELFSKDKGYVSSLTETDENWQFYTILEKYSAKMLEISDIVQPDTTTTVYEYIKMNLTQQKQSQFLMRTIQSLSKSLNTTENVSRKKTGESLDKLLNWDGKK